MEDKIIQIRAKNNDYDYRRMHAELRHGGLSINKKKVQRLVKN
ncbi:IS3 family transposase [Mycoplasma bradburyae]